MGTPSCGQVTLAATPPPGLSPLRAIMAVFFFLFVFIPNKAWHIARKNSRFVSLERGFERKRSCVLPLGTTARQSRGLRPREKRQAARGPGRLPVRGRAAARPARGGGSGHFLLPPRTSRRVAPAADRPPAPCPPHARSEAVSAPPAFPTQNRPRPERRWPPRRRDVRKGHEGLPPRNPQCSP